MFGRIPNRFELGVIALMALACTAVVTLFPKPDYAMMFMAMPLFLVCSLMGLRRNPRFIPAPKPVEPEDELVS